MNKDTYTKKISIVKGFELNLGKNKNPYDKYIDEVVSNYYSKKKGIKIPGLILQDVQEIIGTNADIVVAGNAQDSGISVLAPGELSPSSRSSANSSRSANSVESRFSRSRSPSSRGLPANSPLSSLRSPRGSPFPRGSPVQFRGSPLIFRGSPVNLGRRQSPTNISSRRVSSRSASPRINLRASRSSRTESSPTGLTAQLQNLVI